MGLSRRRTRTAVADAPEVIPALASAVIEGLDFRHTVRQSRVLRALTRFTPKIHASTSATSPSSVAPILKHYRTNLSRLESIENGGEEQEKQETFHVGMQGE